MELEDDLSIVEDFFGASNKIYCFGSSKGNQGIQMEQVLPQKVSLRLSHQGILLTDKAPPTPPFYENNTTPQPQLLELWGALTDGEIDFPSFEDDLEKKSEVDVVVTTQQPIVDSLQGAGNLSASWEETEVLCDGKLEEQEAFPPPEKTLSKEEKRRNKAERDKEAKRRKREEDRRRKEEKTRKNAEYSAKRAREKELSGSTTRKRPRLVSEPEEEGKPEGVDAKKTPRPSKLNALKNLKEVNFRATDFVFPPTHSTTLPRASSSNSAFDSPLTGLKSRELNNMLIEIRRELHARNELQDPMEKLRETKRRWEEANREKRREQKMRNKKKNSR